MTALPRPRDAASLVLLRQDAGGVQVLLGRRPLAARFMPGVYVFPGGGVDRADRLVMGGARLRDDVLGRVARRCTPTRAHALAMAAIRETFEETGLRIARHNELPASGAPWPDAEPWRTFAQESLRPALDALDYVGRAITPPGRARRFNARFFVAWNDVIVGEPRASGELEDLHWCPLAGAAGLRIANVTQFMLKIVTESVAQGRQPERLAVYSYRNEAPVVRFE